MEKSDHIDEDCCVYPEGDRKALSCVRANSKKDLPSNRTLDMSARDLGASLITTQIALPEVF